MNKQKLIKIHNKTKLKLDEYIKWYKKQTSIKLTYNQAVLCLFNYHEGNRTEIKG